MFGHHYRQIPPDPTAPFPQRFRIERVYDTPGPTPYESALDDLAGNEGSEVMSACWAIGKQVEDDFNLDDVMTEEGFQAAKERFEELVEKAYEAFDAYEAKQQAIEEVFNARR